MGIEYDDKELQARMRKAVREFPQMVIKGMEKGVLFLHEEMPDYPPERAGSSYRRTFTLERSITSMVGDAPGALSEVRKERRDVVGLVGTGIKYAPFVIDRDRQASVHVGTWWLLQDYVERQVDKVATIIISEIDVQI